MASKIRTEINIRKIADELVQKKANDDTSLKEFSELVNKVEKIKKVIKPKK